MADLFVGVDVAQASLVPALWINGQAVRLPDCANAPEGVAALAELLDQAQQTYATTGIQLIVEPTGGYELALASFALKQGWTVSRPTPAQVREWARGRGYRAKTDRVDGGMLAH